MGAVETDARGWLALASMGFVVTGCVATPAMNYPGTQVASSRLAALPSEGVVWNYDFYGQRTVDSAAELKAKQNFDDSITYRVRRHGGRSFWAASVVGLGHARAFRSWVVDTLAEIMEERLAASKQQHETVGDFRFSHSLESWRSPLDADFVLVTLFLDGHNTAGRLLAVGVGSGHLAAQRAIACAVHLRSARVVWCNFDPAVNRDLMQRRGAQEEVDLLLGEMLSEGQMAPNEPPPARSDAARLAQADDVPPPPPPPPPVPAPDTPVPVHFQPGPRPSNAAPP